MVITVKSSIRGSRYDTATEKECGKCCGNTVQNNEEDTDIQHYDYRLHLKHQIIVVSV